MLALLARSALLVLLAPLFTHCGARARYVIREARMNVRAAARADHRCYTLVQHVARWGAAPAALREEEGALALVDGGEQPLAAGHPERSSNPPVDAGMEPTTSWSSAFTASVVRGMTRWASSIGSRASPRDSVRSSMALRRARRT